MTKDELIEFMNKELIGLNKELEQSRSNTTYNMIYVEIQRVRQFIVALKNLPNESKTVNRNENAEKICDHKYDYYTNQYSVEVAVCSKCLKAYF